MHSLNSHNSLESSEVFCIKIFALSSNYKISQFYFVSFGEFASKVILTKSTSLLKGGISSEAIKHQYTVVWWWGYNLLGGTTESETLKVKRFQFLGHQKFSQVLFSYKNMTLELQSHQLFSKVTNSVSEI